MTRDRLDEFAERLFDAARHEQPPGTLGRRLVAAMQRNGRSAEEQSWGVAGRTSAGVGMLVAAAAVVAGIVVFGRQGCDKVEITAESPPSVRSSTTNQSIEPVGPASRLQRAEQPGPIGTAAKLRDNVDPRQSTRTVPPTLARELAALQRSRAALRSGDTKLALQELDHYERVLRGRQLSSEAVLLRIEALSVSGQDDEATALARQFVAQNPNSPLVDRARTFATRPSLDAEAEPSQEEDAP